MPFWKSLFGGSSENTEKASEPVEYNGFTIRAAPYKSEGQYQTAGIIEKEIAGVRKEHKFIRADRHASYDDAVEFSLGKRSEEHTSELQSRSDLVCRLLLEKKKEQIKK